MAKGSGRDFLKSLQDYKKLLTRLELKPCLLLWPDCPGLLPSAGGMRGRDEWESSERGCKRRRNEVRARVGGRKTGEG
jgi:hypothetical protein